MHDAQVESSLPQLLHLGCADLFANVELDPRVPRANATNQIRQKIEHRASDDPQANRPLFTARDATDEVGGVRGLFEQGARARDERPPSGGATVPTGDSNWEPESSRSDATS